MLYKVFYNMVYNKITHLHFSFSLSQQALASALLNGNYDT